MCVCVCVACHAWKAFRLTQCDTFMNKRHEIGVTELNRRGQSLSIHLLLSPLMDKPIKPSTLMQATVTFYTKQNRHWLHCVVYFAELSRSTVSRGKENRRKKPTRQIQTGPNQTLRQQHDDCELSCCLIAPLQTSEISQIWKCLWCSLLHKLQHVLIIFSVWLCDTARVRAQRSRPGETLQPERDSFLLPRPVLHLIDPISVSFTKQIK